MIKNFNLKQHIWKTGDHYYKLAHKYYGDATYWWIIAIANPNVIRRDSIAIKEGIELRIPSNHTQIINDFEELNKE